MMEFEIWEDSDNSSEATTIQLDTGAPGSSANENILTPIDPETGLRQSVLEWVHHDGLSVLDLVYTYL